MARITMRVDSRALNRLQRHIDRMPDQITEGVQDAVEESGNVIRDAVERDVGVHSGRLKNRVRVRQIGALGLTADVGWFDADTYYAQFVEFGTSSIEANPVLTRASEAERGEFPGRVRRHVRDAL